MEATTLYHLRRHGVSVGHIHLTAEQYRTIPRDYQGDARARDLPGAHYYPELDVYPDDRLTLIAARPAEPATA